MNRARRVWIKHYFFIVTTVLVFFSFSVNLFGLGDTKEWFYEFQQDSSFLVEKASICKDEQSYYSGILMYSSIKTRGSESCVEQDNIPYASQFGLQARVVRLFAPNDNEKLVRYFGIVQASLALMSALIFGAIANQARKLHGKIPSILLVVGICLSPWLAGYGHNLYWILPLMIAPFAMTYCCYPWFAQHKLQWMLYLVLGLLVFLKLLNGYEHVITVVISIMSALALYEYKNLRKSWRPLAVKFVIVGFVSLVAFVGVFALNIYGLNEYYHSSEKSLNAIKNRADERGFDGRSTLQPDVIVGFRYTLPNTYSMLDYYADISKLESGSGNPISYALLNGANYALLPAINYPLRGAGVGWELVQSITFVAFIGFISLKSAMRKRKEKYDGPLQVAMIIGLLGGIGWLVLMPGHAYPHAHLNAIVFYIPFLLFCYIAIGRYVEVLLLRIKKYASTK